VPLPAGALDDGALDDGALDDGALDDGALELGAELDGAEPVADGAVPEPPEPALSLPPQAARIGALAPANAAIAAQRSTVLRSRSGPFAGASCCGVVVGAIVSSLMNLDLQELPVEVVERYTPSQTTGSRDRFNDPEIEPPLESSL